MVTRTADHTADHAADHTADHVADHTADHVADHVADPTAHAVSLLSNTDSLQTFHPIENVKLASI